MKVAMGLENANHGLGLVEGERAAPNDLRRVSSIAENVFSAVCAVE